MRILYVINTGGTGGIQQHVLTLMKALQGVAEVAFAVNAVLDEKSLLPFEQAGLRVYRLGGRSGHDWRIVRRFKQILEDFKPDVIHAHGLPLLVTIALRVGWYGKLGRVPVFHSLHCPTGCPSWKARLVMNLFERHVVKYWLPVSGPTWEDFRRAYPWAKGEVFFNPLLLADFEPRNTRNTRNVFTIGMVGRAADQKDWPSFHKVETLVKDQFEENVTLSGKGQELVFLNAGETALCDGRAAIRSMDLFVMTSKHEQLPTTVLECFALGTPICGFLPAGGTSDILQFSNGSVRDAFITERSCDKLADLVLDLMEHPEKRQALVEDGKQILENHFDAVKNCRGQLMRIYESVKSGKSVVEAGHTSGEGINNGLSELSGLREAGGADESVKSGKSVVEALRTGAGGNNNGLSELSGLREAGGADESVKFGKSVVETGRMSVEGNNNGLSELSGLGEECDRG